MLPLLKTYVLPTVLCLAGLAGLYLLGLLLAKATGALHQLGDKLEMEKRNHWQVMCARAAEALSRCASDAVAQVEAKVRPTILGAAAGGKLDESQAKALAEQAKDLAWEQAKSCFGSLLAQVGENVLAVAAPPALGALVESAATKLAGDSRKNGVAPPPVVPPVPAQA